MNRILGLGAVFAAVIVAAASFVMIFGLGVWTPERDSGTPFRIADGYVRSVGANAMAGGAYMVIHNLSGADDRLIGVQTDASDLAELHGHTEDANGVMMMRPIEGGILIPAGGQAVLERGADHVMLMGLHSGLAEGSQVRITLRFEKAGEFVVDVPMDSSR